MQTIWSPKLLIGALREATGAVEVLTDVPANQRFREIRRSFRGLLPAVLPRPAPWACGRGPRARERMGTQGSPVKSYDYLLKFLLVGDSDVGKGEILESLQDGAAESPYAYSNGADTPWQGNPHFVEDG
uniref:ras-related protein Rab-40C n=1 Tax=Panthera onca TaxID=9690 RepID=UPI00295453BB|nr:ras-related protein Rab-40C [Panthera onca]